MSDTLTTEQVEEILAGCEGVTPGPWRRHESPQETSVQSDTSTVVVVPWGRGGASLHNAHRDAAHLSRLDPQTVSSLATELLALRKRVGELEGALAPFARIADMEEQADPFDAVAVNVTRCRDARAVLARPTTEDVRSEERKRAVAAIHWVFNADGTVGERAMAQEAIHKINDPTFMPALTAYEAAKGGGVGVKPLEWPDTIRQGQRVESRGGLCTYTVAHYGGSLPDSGVVYRWARERGPWSEAFFAYEHAIRAAQADYEDRISSALTSPASGSAQPRSFWMHYDHQSGRWVVDDRPPNVVRTDSEVIHVLEVLPTSPASGERDAVIEDGFIGDDFAEVYRILRDEGTTHAALTAALSNNLNVIIAALARASAGGSA